MYHQLLLLLLGQLTPAGKSASALHGPGAHAAEPRGTAVFDALYAQPEALATLMHAGPFSIWHTIDLLCGEGSIHALCVRLPS